MISEVLNVLIEVVQQGRTMLCVTHDMSFARRVADRVIVMDRGCIEEAPPERSFTSPQHERTRQFLSSVR